MSKADHAEGQRELTVQEKAIVAMRRDLIGVRNKVLGEFLLLTKESGAVDTTSAGFKEMHNSFMAINDKANQLSLQATEEGVLKRIEKLQNEGLDQGVGQKLKDDMVVLRKELESVLSSKENLEKGLVDYCKMRTLQTSPFQVIETKDTPMRKAGDPRPMGQDEIAELYGKLQPALSDIDIPVTSLSDIAAMGSAVVDGRLSPIARNRMEEFFGKKDKKGNLILDREKLTPENIKAFGVAVNEDLTKELAKMKAEHLIQDAIEQMQSEYGVTCTPEIYEGLVKTLKPTVTALGSEYIEANRGMLTKDLTKDLINILPKELAKAESKHLIQDVIRQMNSEYGVQYSRETATRIIDGLEQTVTALGPDYIKDNKEMLTKALSSSLRKGQGYFDRGKDEYSTSDLEKVASKFNKEYQPLADLEQQQSIESSLFGLQMKDSKLAEKLTELGVEKAKASKYDAAKISEDDFVRMRRENPEQFDRVILKRGENAPDLTAVIDGIIVKAVYKLQKENGVKLTPEKVEDLKKQIKDNLTPALSKLDSEFLYSQREDISSNIQKQLYKNRPLGYTFGVRFSISDKSLVNISSGIIADYQKPSADFELQAVRLGMGASHANNTELAKRLNELAVEKARAVKYDVNDISSEALLKIRKENPALFDKVVLGKEPAAKQVVAAPVQEQVQVVAPPSLSSAPPPPPPLLSERQKDPAVLVQEQQKIMTGVQLAPPPPRDGGQSGNGAPAARPEGVRRSPPALPSSAPPPRNGDQSGKGSPAAGPKEQEGVRRSPPPLPSSSPPPRDGDQSGKGSPAAGPKEQQEVRRPSPPPRSRFAPPPRDRSQSGQEFLAAAFKEQQEAKGPLQPPRDSSQNGQEVPTVSSKDQRGARRPPPPPPRNRSQNNKEGSVVSLKEPGALLHPQTTPYPRLTPEGRKGGLDR